MQSYSSGSNNDKILCEKGPGSKLWLVILNRFDGKTDFYGPNFTEYEKTGVGTPPS